MEEGIHDVLLKKRVIYLNNRISEKEAIRISDAIILLNAESSEPITLYINSGGGNLDAALAIYDILKHSRAPVTGIVQQSTYSGASIVLQGCAMRKALQHARILIHNGIVNVEKDVDDIQENMEKVIRETIADTLKKRTYMYAVYAERTGKPVEEIKKLCLADKIIYADEAKAIGLIDEVVV